jgi:hypothetical protein
MYAKAGVGEDLFPPCAELAHNQHQEDDPQAAQDMEGVEEGGKSISSTGSSKAPSSDDLSKNQSKRNFTLFPRYGKVLVVHNSRLFVLSVTVTQGMHAELAMSMQLRFTKSSAMLACIAACRAGVVYAVRNSNWSVDDVVSSGAPLVYDCTPTRPTGLPKEAMWLKRAGVKCMISLPCMHEGSVRGVLTVGLDRLSSLEHTWLPRLQQLAYKITPFVVEACAEQLVLLANGRLQRFRSTNDIAASMLDELCVLDKILLAGLVSSPRHHLTGAGMHASVAAASAAHIAYAQDGPSNSGAAASKAVAATGLSLALEALGQDAGLLGPLGPSELMPWPTPVLWPKTEPAPAAPAAAASGRWAPSSNKGPAVGHHHPHHPRMLADTGSSQQQHQVGGLTPQSVRRAANAAAAAARSVVATATATLLPHSVINGSAAGSETRSPEANALRSLKHLPPSPTQPNQNGKVTPEGSGMLSEEQLRQLPITSPVAPPSPASRVAQEPSGVVGPPAYVGDVPWHLDVDAEEALASAARVGSLTERLQGSVAYQEAVASLMLQGGLVSDTSSSKSTVPAQPVCVISAGDDELDTTSPQQHPHQQHQHHQLAATLPWLSQPVSQRASYEGPGAAASHSAGGFPSATPGMLQSHGQDARFEVGSPRSTPGLHQAFNLHQQHALHLAAHGSAPVPNGIWQQPHMHMHAPGPVRYQHMHQSGGHSSHSSLQGGVSGAGVGICDRQAQRSCPSAWDQHTAAMVQQAQRSAHHAAMYFHSQPMQYIPGAPFLYAAQQPMQQSRRMEDVLSEVGR